MTKTLVRTFALVALMLASVTVLPAQSVANLAAPTAAATVPAVTDTPIGPRATQSAVALPASAAETALGSLQTRSADRSNVAWMAVGGAALMIGLLVGGDAGAVVAVGGGVIALVGLYRYMR